MDYDDVLDEGFEEYRKFMFETYEGLIKHRVFFLRDRTFSLNFKYERVQELIDFFVLEDEFEKCLELSKIKEAVEIQYILNI